MTFHRLGSCNKYFYVLYHLTGLLKTSFRKQQKAQQLKKKKNFSGIYLFTLFYLELYYIYQNVRDYFLEIVVS